MEPYRGRQPTALAVGTFGPDTMGAAVEQLGRLPISVVPTVAAAEHLGVDLLTRDGALRAVPGIRCTVRVP